MVTRRETALPRTPWRGLRPGWRPRGLRWHDRRARARHLRVEPAARRNRSGARHLAAPACRWRASPPPASRL